jgi:uncharacterized protein (TIGR03067 family)
MIHFLPQTVLAGGTKYRSAVTPEAPPSSRDGAEQDLTELQDSWLLVYWLYDGREQSAPGGRPVISFAADQFTIRVVEVVIERGRFEALAPYRSPKAFDYAPTEVAGKPVQLKYPAIYLVEGDLFIACVGYKGGRPEAFSARAGSGQELVVYTRLKG